MTLTLRGRIVLTLVPLLVLLALLGGTGMVLLHGLGGRIDAILRENYDSIIAMERLGEALERIDSSFQFTLSDQEQKARDQYDRNWTIYLANLRFEKGHVTLPGEKELVEQLSELTESYRQQGDMFYARPPMDPRRQDDYFGSSGLLESFSAIKAVTSEIARINQDNMEEASRKAKKTAVVSLMGFTIGLTAAGLLAVGAAWQTFRTILRPIQAVTQAALGVGAGKLDQVVPYLSRDALGQLTEAFNHMTRQLREHRQSVQERTEELVRMTESLRGEISEREQMERSLRQMAAIVESSDDAIFGMSLDGIITSWNKGAEQLFGYSAERIVGQPQYVLVPPEHDNELPIIREMIKCGEHVERFETVRRKKDGTRVCVSLTDSPVKDETGAVIGMACIARDITQRKQAEEALRRASAYNRRLIEASLDPLVTIGPDGKITDVNAATESATGYSRMELVGQDFADYFTEPEKARAGYQCVFSEGSVRNYPLEMRHRNGHVTSVLYNAAVYEDEIGRVVGVFAAARDVTERKKAEEALRTSETNLRRAQAVAHIGSWYLDIPLNELHWSDETYRIFQMPEGAPLTYQQFLAIVHPEDREFVDRAWKAAMQGAPYDIEHRIQVDGDTRWIREKAEITLDANGHPVLGIGIAHDITDRKRAEEKGQRLAHLQEVVADLGQRALRARRDEDVLNEAVTLVAQALAVDYCNVMTLLPGDEELLLRAGVGWKEGLVGRATVKCQGSQPGYVVRCECPVIVENAASETRFVPLPRLLGEEGVSAVSVVILTPEGPYGALGAHTRLRRTFTTDEVNFLQAVANVLGAAIQRQRGEEHLRRSNRALRALSRCNQAMIRVTDESAWLEQVCRLIVEEAGYRFCWVGYAEQDEARTVRPVAQAGQEEGYLKSVNITWAESDRGRGPTGTCIRTRRTVVFKNLATDPAFAPWRPEAVKRGYASAAGIPLLAENQTLGALTIYSSEPDAFGDEEMQLLTELAGDLAFGVMTLRTRIEQSASAALEAAHQREVEIGFKIQQTLLLDQPPVDFPGLHVAALTFPSDKIDGDFYAFSQHENQHLDVIVADVMGKGIPAALLGAAIKSHFHKALSHLMPLLRDDQLPEPREIVTLAHAEMVQHLLELESFVTLCYVRFDPNRRRLDLVDCGHTGLIHWRAATGCCEVVHGDNLALGFRQDEIFDQLSVSFEPGDLFLLYSDGITEVRNPSGKFFGEDRLLQCLQTNSQLGPEGLLQAIRTAAVVFAESELPADDMTCVAVQVVERQLPLRRVGLEIASDLKELGRARDFVRALCGQLPGSALDEASVGGLELAITEACSNIIKHAYQGRSDQWIHLEAETFPTRVTIRLHHLGAAFDPSKVPPPSLDGSQLSGYGVYLIRQCVDEVRYYRDERGRNCIALVKAFKT